MSIPPSGRKAKAQGTSRPPTTPSAFSPCPRAKGSPISPKRNPLRLSILRGGYPKGGPRPQEQGTFPQTGLQALGSRITFTAWPEAKRPKASR
ncbi:hypothetical protein FJNA_06060 [Thermus sp. FJN-A]